MGGALKKAPNLSGKKGLKIKRNKASIRWDKGENLTENKCCQFSIIFKEVRWDSKISKGYAKNGINSNLTKTDTIIIFFIVK